jgi:hypothetical protein
MRFDFIFDRLRKQFRNVVALQATLCLRRELSRTSHQGENRDDPRNFGAKYDNSAWRRSRPNIVRSLMNGLKRSATRPVFWVSIASSRRMPDGSCNSLVLFTEMAPSNLESTDSLEVKWIEWRKKLT